MTQATQAAIATQAANLLLHEPITADLLIGSGLITGGVALAPWPGRRPR